MNDTNHDSSGNPEEGSAAGAPDAETVETNVGEGGAAEGGEAPADAAEGEAEAPAGGTGGGH